MSHISEAAFALIIAEGQLENAIKEERRWRLRRQEALEAELNARDTIIKYQRVIETLKRGLCNNGYNGRGEYESGEGASVAGNRRYA